MIHSRSTTEQKTINPWTFEERLLFLERFTLGKDFESIASYFEYKTVHDVVQFYYCNNKRLNLSKLMKDAKLQQKNGINPKRLLAKAAALPDDGRRISP